MRTIFFILFLFFALSKISHAQRVFQKHFGIGNTAYGPYGMTSTPSCVNVFYSIGDCFDIWNNAQCFGIGLLTFDSLDNPGSNYYYHDASDDTVHAAQYASNIGGGKSIVAGLCRDMNYNHQVSLYMFDSLNNFIKGRALDYGGDGCRFEIVKPAPSLNSYYAFGLLDSTYASNYEGKILFCRFDSLLAPLFSKTFTILYSPQILDFTFAKDSNIVACGYSSDSSFKSSIVIIKLDTTGNIIWNKKYSAFRSTYASSIFAVGDNFYITGTLNDSDYMSAPQFLIKTDSLGNVIWCKKYYGHKFQVHTIRTIDSGFLTSSQYDYHGSIVSSLSKIDSTGNFQWGYGYAFGESNYFQCERPDKGFYTYGRAQFMDSTYIYIIKTDSLGRSGCLEEPFTLSVSTNCMFWPDTISITAADYMPPSFPIQLIRDTFQLNEITYCDGISDVPDLIIKSNRVLIYPNPVINDELKAIIEGEENQPATLRIYDSIGKIVYENKLHLNPGRNELVIPLNKMPDGLYFLQVEQKEYHSSCKFLKAKCR